MRISGLRIAIKAQILVNFKMLEMGIGTWFRIVLKDAVLKRRSYAENLAKNSEVQGIKAV